jgi:hypothetical protein
MVMTMSAQSGSTGMKEITSRLMLATMTSHRAGDAVAAARGDCPDHGRTRTPIAASPTALHVRDASGSHGDGPQTGHTAGPSQVI